MGECMLTRRGGAGGVYPDHIEVTTPPTNTVYLDTSSFSSNGMKVSAVYPDGSTADITGYINYTTYLTANNHISENMDISVWWGSQAKDGIKYFGTDVPVEVRGTVSSVYISTKPTKLTYVEGEQLDLTGLVVKAYGKSGFYPDYDAEAQAAAGSSPSSYSTPYEGYITSVTDGTTLTTTGTQTIYVYMCRYTDTDTSTKVRSTSFSITVNKAVEKLEITTPPKQYYTVSTSGRTSVGISSMVITATYADGTTETVDNSNVTYGLNGGTGTTLYYGDYTLNVSCTYGGKTIAQDYKVQVRATWADGDLRIIKSMIAEADAGEIDLTNFWSIGDERTVYITGEIPATGNIPICKSGQNLTWVLMDSNCKGFTVTSTGKKPNFIIALENCIPMTGITLKELATAAPYGWRTSEIRAWANEQFKNAQPENFSAILKQFTWKLAESATTTAYNNGYLAEITDYIAIPPSKAIEGSGYYSDDKEDALYEQWSAFTWSSPNYKKKYEYYYSFSTVEYWTSSIVTRLTGDTISYATISSKGSTDYEYVNTNLHCLTFFACI